MLWAEKMCSFTYLLLESRHNPLRESGLSMHWLCGKDDLASEDTLVWAAFDALQHPIGTFVKLTRGQLLDNNSIAFEIDN